MAEIPRCSVLEAQDHRDHLLKCEKLISNVNMQRHHEHINLPESRSSPGSIFGVKKAINKLR